MVEQRGAFSIKRDRARLCSNSLYHVRRTLAEACSGKHNCCCSTPENCVGFEEKKLWNECVVINEVGYIFNWELIIACLHPHAFIGANYDGVSDDWPHILWIPLRNGGN